MTIFGAGFLRFSLPTVLRREDRAMKMETQHGLMNADSQFHQRDEIL